MIKLFKKGSKQRRGSRTNRGKKNKNDSPAENFSLNPEDDRWLRIFKRAMGNETFADFRNKIGKSSSPVECESVFEEFSEHLKWISIPDRESCTPEQVNKDLTRDKLIVNSREFVDHTRGTASQGLIKHLRNGVRAVICDALRSTYLSMAPDRAQRELDATLEWILQACTRTSHGADSFFAVHSLFGSAKPKSSLRPSMPMWLITPAQNATSQDSEVFVASGSDNKPFVFVCNFNDYCVQRRDHAMIRNSKDHGGNRLPMLLRTVVVEALDPSSITTAHASGSGVSSRLRGARVLCIASNRDYRNIRRRRLFRNMKRRAIRAHRLRKIRTAFEDWRVATAISRYGTVERVRARAELEHFVESSKVEVERKKAEVASVKKECEGLVRTLEGLRGDVDVIETQVQDAALRNADLESDLDERLRKLEKMRQSIFRLKEQRLRSPAIRRNGVVTNLQTPRDMMRSRIFAVATERPQQQVVAGGEGEASEDVPLSIICTKRTAAKILRRRTGNPRGRRNGGGGGGNLIARERTHSDFERLVQDVTSTSTTTPKRERGKCPEHFSVVSRRSRRRRNRQHQQDSARKRTHLGARPLSLCFRNFATFDR
eukprot:g3046.t1